MKNEDLFTLANAFLKTMNENTKKEDEPQEEQKTKGILIKKEGGKEIEGIIVSKLFNIAQEQINKKNSTKADNNSARKTDNDHFPDNFSDDNKKTRKYDFPEENNAEESNKNNQKEMTKCFEEVIAANKQNYSQNINFVELEEKCIIEILVPGLSKEEVNLSIKGNNIIVKINKKPESHYSVFSPNTILDDIIIDDKIYDIRKIKANVENGILTIQIPKKEKEEIVEHSIIIE